MAGSTQIRLDAAARAAAGTALAAIAIVAAGCGSEGTEPPTAPSRIGLSSPAFADGATIPKEFTCDGDDVSPPLRWSGAPKGAAELALVVDDPDAPGGTFNHWALLGIDPGTRGLAAGSVPAGATQAKNGAGETGYSGPCPPSGEDPHHYRFVLYALKRKLSLGNGAPAKQVVEAIAADAIAQGTLTGTYGR